MHCKRDALCTIYEKYRDSLLILALALSHNEHLAEDAVQDVFINFAGNFDEFNFNSNLKAYLFKCVANRVRDLQRKEKVVSTATQKSELKPFPNANEPSQMIVYNEQIRLLSSALAKLPYEQREVVVLHIYGKMRFRNIAKFTGASSNTVKGRFRYGIQKMRKFLDSEK